MNDQFLQNAFLFRQPILNRRQELAGYQLSFHGGQDVNDDDDDAGYRGAGAPLCAAYSELGLYSALGKTCAYIGVDGDFLHQKAIELLPPQGVVLELLLDGVPERTTLVRCRALLQRGYSLALSDYQGIDERSRPLLPLVSVIKIDLRHADQLCLEELAGPLRQLPIKLLAQGVASHEQMERCRNLGFALFQGRYFAQAEIVSGRRLSAAHATLIRLSNLVGRDVDTAVIEDAFKHEPALTLNLLRIVNSVGRLGNRSTQPVTSLRHAITLLGRRQLQRWLSLLLLAPTNNGNDSLDPTRSPLLQVAALRGRMMELLVAVGKPGELKLADLAFITGILSMMPAALGLPIEEILDQIAVEREVSDALRQHEGLLGTILALLECFDNDDAACCDKLLSRLPGPYDRQTLNTGLSAALSWLNSSGDDE
ncbi:MAG: EAL domain protein [Candidatus Accumulibacter appositus]|uniref:EAL domain protein n=1 Tax=Candidatus Accumulibacter appositus TaxID=1454003 RepID=A0A011PVI4_9PROT|nr:HDOD domain-containing protein [Accumulibacter sp.]EXI80850.1 MAG: EAL domain protein [Candidatus Accumulibacter appositus]HRF03893.1 EAL domain-containing protein [Accumulibacter sp.]